ncbi:MAG: YdeI/OmpD-associated family protein [Aquimonas sp.]
MITAIEDYFSLGCGRCERFATADCATRIWREGLAALRQICREAGLQETVKWGHPCYLHGGRNVAILGALRADFRLSFFDAALLTDPERILEAQGPNTRQPDMIRFRDAADVVRLEPFIRAYLAEAMGYADAGLRPPRATEELELTEELVAAMAVDPELAEAFHRLTPGRRNSYVVNLKSAKAASTRTARIAKFRDRILSGKGATER